MRRADELGRQALAWCFERLYQELAWAYDAVSWVVSGGRWRYWQRSVLPHLLPGPLLEVGPGPGHLLSELLAGGHDARAVERSPAMLRRAQARLLRAGFPGRLVGGDALALPFASRSFSSVVTTFPSSFALRAEFLAEVSRVLRPGGRLVIALGAESGAWPWPGIIEWAIRRALGEGRPGQRPGGAPELGRPTTEDGRAHEAADTVADGGAGGRLSLARLEARGPAGVVYLLVGTRRADA